MNNHHSPQSSWRTYSWGLLTVLTCPCYLPILALLLSGTAAGAALGEHIVLFTLVIVALFVFAFIRAVQAFRTLR